MTENQNPEQKARDRIDAQLRQAGWAVQKKIDFGSGLGQAVREWQTDVGPNDHPQLKKVEHRARMANWFDVIRQESDKYVFHPKAGFDRLLDKTRQALGALLGEVERLLEPMLPMTMRQAEILATVYAAWNNLLLIGKAPSDEEIVATKGEV